MSVPPPAGAGPVAERAGLVAALARSLSATTRGTRAPADAPVILETHLSWVILDAEDAWKIKKPVAFDFVDFSTLERRRVACEAELTLNRRYSPSLYVGVVPIVGTAAAPRLAPTAPVAGPKAGDADSGAGTPIEYAVRMKRFSQHEIFSAMIAEDRLDADGIDALASHVAALHAAATGTPDPDAGTPAVVGRQVLQAADGVASVLDDARAARVRTRLARVLDASQPVLETRRAQGFVRECHADLHLSNICRYRGAVAVFDCLEFDPLLRRIDVMADLAFIVADLLAWRRQDLAYRLLDRYLTQSGDHGGLRVLRLYIAYRAMVRARVALLRVAGSPSAGPPAASGGPPPASRPPSVTDYVAVADEILDPVKPTLAILHGLSGSGKSRVAERLVERLPLIRLRSDVERKRLLGLPASARTGSPPGQGAYGAEHSRSVYAQLASKAALAAGAGFAVLVDATFQRREDRRRFADLARSLGVPFLIVDVRADEDVLCTRIRQRLALANDPSEADEQVLAMQIGADEPLDPDECRARVAFDNSATRDAAALDAALGPVRERLMPAGATGA